MTTSDGLVSARQRPLQQRYRIAPSEALITDRAATCTRPDTDAFHGTLSPGLRADVQWNYGIHRAVGGYHDAPNPGDILCAALAACQESTLRMIAEHVGVALGRVEVEVSARVDVRGTLLVDAAVPIGFQSLECTTKIELLEDVAPDRLDLLFELTEHCCIILDTLRRGVRVTTAREVERGPSPDVHEAAQARGGEVG